MYANRDFSISLMFFYYLRHHVPVAFYVLFHLNNLFLVINSSINFIIYCSVGKEFRKQMFLLLKNIKKRDHSTTRSVVTYTARD